MLYLDCNRSFFCFLLISVVVGRVRSLLFVCRFGVEEVVVVFWGSEVLGSLNALMGREWCGSRRIACCLCPGKLGFLLLLVL